MNTLVEGPLLVGGVGLGLPLFPTPWSHVCRCVVVKSSHMAKYRDAAFKLYLYSCVCF